MKKKSLENKLKSELKNIKNTIFENFKNSKMTPKNGKNVFGHVTYSWLPI